MSHRTAFHLLLAAVVATLASPALAQEGAWGGPSTGPGPGGYGVQLDAEPGDVSLETFQAGLSPYGEWVRSDLHGMVWRPRVAAGWRPYYFGRWEWTNEGWLWVSEEPFGWATYHYGRWGFDRSQGWLWVPGYQWAPAWVSWRFGGDAVGWAPLAPGLSLYVTSYAFVDFWWTFVPSARFCGSPVWGVAYPPARASQLYGVTRPAPPRARPPGAGLPHRGQALRAPSEPQRAPAWGGPPPRFIEERTGRAVHTSRIVAQPRPGAIPGRAGEIGVYRPEVTSRVGAAPRPATQQRPGHQGIPAQPRQEARPGAASRGSPAPSGGPSARGGGTRPEAPPPAHGARPRSEGRRGR